MPLPSGTRLGPYAIVTPLGAGGMGEVYAARDTRLDRSVAIKVLPREFSDDAGRRARFEREAMAIASLSHPNICTLHDVGQHDGTMFLVMEKLEGITLAVRLAQGPMPPAEAIACAIQIAEGLAFAHRAGVVHRDLKPANVMLTRTGAGSTSAPQAKLLDFGLAKVSADAAEHPTATALTFQGEILGTLPYMAPEQLQGGDVDARADIFAFGAMLHEMFTGQRAFAGASQASIIGAILHAEPAPLSQRVPNTPRALERIVSVCLAKDRDERWSSARDVLLQLKGLAAGDSGSDRVAPIPAPARRAAGLAWALAVVGLVTTAVLGGWLATRRPEPGRPSTVLSIMPPQDSTFVRGEAPQIAPDGRHLAFSSTDRAGVRGLYLRSLDTAAPRFLPGTENGTLPFWSPDSRMLGFFADGQLKTVALAGGTPTVLARSGLPRGAAWSKDNLILFSQRPTEPLVFVSATGGEPTPVPTQPKHGASFPSFLPDGRHFIFTELGAEDRLAESLVLGSLDGPETRRLVGTNASGVYASGHLLFMRNTSLLAQPFDPETLRLGGEPVAVAEDVGRNPVTFQALFSASNTGVLTYRDAAPGAELVWFSRSGARLSAVGSPGEFNVLCMMPDGRRIVFDQADSASGNIDLWTMDLATSATTQLTFAGPVEFYPVCAPNSRDLALAALKPTNPNLFRQSLSAPGQIVSLLDSPLPKIPTDWSGDGSQLIYAVLTPGTGWDVASLSLESGQSRALVATPAGEQNAGLSPDGRWLAYGSNSSGRYEIYVQAMAGGGAKWLVSRGGGVQPQWSANGRQLYYIALDRKLMVVDAGVDGNAFVPSAPLVLMDTRITQWESSSNQGDSYAVAPDGTRVLISTATDTGRPVSLVSNWPARVTR
jgi:eukaryotic-like serine/threonine-protein kinase